MKSFGVAAAIAAASFVGSAVADVDPIVISGAKFFYKTNGTQFFIKGVAYQQGVGVDGSTSGSSASTSSTSGSTQYTDPLADPASCQRDIPYLTQLSTNTIRVYAIDPTKDHSQCMQMLQDAGIYVISDLSQPDLSINRDDPQWNNQLYARYTSVVDALANYTNVMGFFAGNEVSNAPNNTDASAFVKAAVRDTKAYIKQMNYRTIGVGYATNDDASIRENMADYFNCGDQANGIDFWGYNIYSWCGGSSYTKSGYDVRTEEFSKYSVPSFFAEYGCNTVQPREFTEVAALFGPQMSPVWSGGIIYMYFEETNNYGLVNVSGSSVTTLADFASLSSQIAMVTPSSVNSASYSPSLSQQACPTVDGTNWDAQSTPLPPTPNEQLCSCMYESLSCVVAANVDAENYGTLFGQVCGLGGSVCAGIASNSSTGTYGAYGMCNATQQLGYVFNQYAAGQSNNPSACDFGGSATSQAATTGVKACTALLAEAGTAGTGTVTTAPSGTAAAGGSGGKGSATPKKGAAIALSAPASSSGVFQLAAFVLVAVTSGVGMVLL